MVYTKVLEMVATVLHKAPFLVGSPHREVRGVSETR